MLFFHAVAADPVKNGCGQGLRKKATSCRSLSSFFDYGPCTPSNRLKASLLVGSAFAQSTQVRLRAVQDCRCLTKASIIDTKRSHC
jgi:hypothetical protein